MEEKQGCELTEIAIMPRPAPRGRYGAEELVGLLQTQTNEKATINHTYVLRGIF